MSSNPHPGTRSFGMLDAYQQLRDIFREKGDLKWEESMKSLVNSTVPGLSTNYEEINLDEQGKYLLPLLTPFQNGGFYGVKTGEKGQSRQYRAIVGKNASKNSGIAPEATGAGAVTGLGRAPVVDYKFQAKEKFFMKLAPEAAISRELAEQSGALNAFGSVTTASLTTAKELEERHILFDCGTALGTTGTPVGTPSNTGGVLTNAASPYTVSVAALNYWGWWYYSDAPAADLTNTAGVIPTQAIAATSANVTIASGTTGSIAATCPSKKGAFGYVWYITTGGVTKFAGSTTVPSITITNFTGFAASALCTVDGSLLDLQSQTVIWDGLWAQIVLDTDLPGEYIDQVTSSSLGGAALTATASGCGIAEFETIFLNLALKRGLSPTVAVASMRTCKAISNIALGATNPAYRFNLDADGDGKIKAGSVLAELRNQYMQTTVELLPHPLMPDGKVLFYTKKIDYPGSNVGTNFELHCGDHFLQCFFARTADVAPPGPWSIRTVGAPTLYFPASCGGVDNIIVT